MSELKRYGVTAGVLIAMSAVAAAVWVWWASPALWEVRDRGLILTESASEGDFNVVATFTVIGAVLTLIWGWWAERRHPDVGWSIVAFVVVVAAISSVVTWQLGVAWGPPDPSTVEGLSVGATVPSELQIDTVAPFVVWAMFAVTGALLSTWFRANDDAEFEPML